jgi:hypothetical protein
MVFSRLALFLAYEYLFARIDVRNSDRKLANNLKKLVFVAFNIKIWRLLQRAASHNW